MYAVLEPSFGLSRMFANSKQLEAYIKSQSFPIDKTDRLLTELEAHANASDPIDIGISGIAVRIPKDTMFVVLVRPTDRFSPTFDDDGTQFSIAMGRDHDDILAEMKEKFGNLISYDTIENIRDHITEAEKLEALHSQEYRFHRTFAGRSEINLFVLDVHED